MLFEALLLSGIILAVVNVAYCWRKPAVSVAWTIAALVVIAPAFLFHPFFSPFWLRPRDVLIVQSLFLVVVVHKGIKGKWKAPSFLAVSFLATITAFVAFLVPPLVTHFRYGGFRAEYPFESLDERLATAKPSKENRNLSAVTMQHLAQHEKSLEDRGPGFRPGQLRQIHNEHWDTFINSPGFGELRRFRPSEDKLKTEPFPNQPVPQPESSGPPFSSEPGKNPMVEEATSLFGLHKAGFIDFINVEGFGYVKGRRAAGFQPHGFRAVPKDENWKVQRVDLIGLLLHDAPVVYLTDGLPRMDQARRSPTRRLDSFEKLGLASLEKGHDLFVQEYPQSLRMVGALRTISQCQKCHGGERGDLLGAFSYWLLKQ